MLIRNRCRPAIDLLTAWQQSALCLKWPESNLAITIKWTFD
jgi:hypothetical protein